MSDMTKFGKFQVAGRIVEILPEQTFASGFTKREIVVDVSKNESYPSPVRLTFKKDDANKINTLLVGDGVEIEGFVSGRSFDGAKGRQYYVDLEAKTVLVRDKAESPAKPTTATTWEELLTLAAAYGEGKDDVVMRCKNNGRPFKEMTANDWAEMAARIIADHADTPADTEDAGSDDLPF